MAIPENNLVQTFATEFPDQPAEVSKVEALAQAIDNIDSVYSRLSELLERIHGQAPKLVGAEAACNPNPTLSTLLSEGATNINQKCRDMESQITEITQELF